MRRHPIYSKTCLQGALWWEDTLWSGDIFFEWCQETWSTVNKTSHQGTVSSGDPLIMGHLSSGDPLIRGPSLQGSPLFRGHLSSGEPLIRVTSLQGSPLIRGPSHQGTPLIRGTSLQRSPLIRGHLSSGDPLFRGHLSSGVTSLQGNLSSGSPLFRGHLSSEVTSHQGSPLIRGPSHQGSPLIRGHLSSGDFSCGAFCHLTCKCSSGEGTPLVWGQCCCGAEVSPDQRFHIYMHSPWEIEVPRVSKWIITTNKRWYDRMPNTGLHTYMGAWMGVKRIANWGPYLLLNNELEPYFLTISE